MGSNPPFNHVSVIQTYRKTHNLSKSRNNHHSDASVRTLQNWKTRSATSVVTDMHDEKC